MNFFEKMVGRFEIVGRARTLAVLRQQSDRTLVDLGFSPDLVRIGVKAWPWRAEDDLVTPISLPNSHFATVAKPDFASSIEANVGQVNIPAASKAVNDEFETAA